MNLIDNTAAIEDSPDRFTHLWALRTRDHRLIECVMQYEPNGVEVQIACDGQRLLSCVFPTGAGALAWADHELETYARILAPAED